MDFECLKAVEDGLKSGIWSMREKRRGNHFYFFLILGIAQRSNTAACLLVGSVFFDKLLLSAA